MGLFGRNVKVTGDVQQHNASILWRLSSVTQWLKPKSGRAGLTYSLLCAVAVVFFCNGRDKLCRINYLRTLCVGEMPILLRTLFAARKSQQPKRPHRKIVMCTHKTKRSWTFFLRQSIVYSCVCFSSHGHVCCTRARPHQTATQQLDQCQRGDLYRHEKSGFCASIANSRDCRFFVCSNVGIDGTLAHAHTHASGCIV